MEFQTNPDIRFITNETFEEKIKQIEIDMYHEQVMPKRIVATTPASTSANELVEVTRYDSSEGIRMDRKEQVIVDFGEHCVGRVSLAITSLGSPPDAPAKLRLSFGETPIEVTRSLDSYKGELSASWLQEELLTIDVLPETMELKRRFAFRYLKIEVVDTSPKYQINLKLSCTTESSADKRKMKRLETDDQLLQEIDRVSQKTLMQCMQDVFEDGPKRDRRLWLGDLRLQALANYATFGANDLVKKCLYLFAAQTTSEGQVSANVFIEPRLIPDDTFLADYSLFFIDTLLDYYRETKDKQTLTDLYATAVAQLRVLESSILPNGKIDVPQGWWAFIDWNEPLDKQIAIQGIFIYSYKRLKELAAFMEDNKLVGELDDKIKILEQYALTTYYDEEKGLFVDPASGQIAIPSQTWMLLAEIGDAELRRNVLENLLAMDDERVVGCNSPYMYHHYVEALLQEGFREEAIRIIKLYWGGMVENGADTFWEVYYPEEVTFSPYGDEMINSYCHAWSCTPCYLFRKYGIA